MLQTIDIDNSISMLQTIPGYTSHAATTLNIYGFIDGQHLLHVK